MMSSFILINGSLMALSFQEAVRLTFQRNPELQVLKEELEKSRGQIIQAGLRPNPRLTYGLEGGSMALMLQNKLSESLRNFFWVINSKKVFRGQKQNTKSSNRI